eukprot:c10127_g2_i1.p1 GENE.c10127_g2_i1~~c10127_g2_i1.p1  ORF type:complete len:555 (-),score=140.15 c10127_g2_i1:62-1513(-)
MEEFVVLKPQRVIDAIAQVITISEYLQKRIVHNRDRMSNYLTKAILADELLQELWKEKGFTSQEIEVFRFIMEKHYLMTQVRSKERLEYLVPSMLTDTSEVVSIDVRHTAKLVFYDKDKNRIFPSHVFLLLLAKCWQWSQLTSYNDTTTYSRNFLNASFGCHVFQLIFDRTNHVIRINIASSFAGAVLSQILSLLRKLNQESFPLLNYECFVDVTTKSQQSQPQLPDSFEFNWNQLKKMLEDKETVFPVKTSSTIATIDIDHLALDCWFAGGGDSYHFFTSYRVSTDKDLADLLVDTCSGFTVDRRDWLKGYLDTRCLEPGQPWRQGFINGLIHSLVFCPIISVECLKTISENGAKGNEDNVLVEWIVALTCYKAGVIKAILPIIVDPKADVFAFKKSLPNKVNTQTNKICCDMLNQAGVACNHSDVMKLSVRDVFNSMLEFQINIFLSDLATPSDQLFGTDWEKIGLCAQRILQVVRRVKGQ